MVTPLQSLTKPPTEYPDKKSLPHVQVAMRMLSRNVPVQSGDVVPYIVCEVGQTDTPHIPLSLNYLFINVMSLMYYWAG